MKIISSRQNTDFKRLKAIASDSRARRSDEAAWLEGDRLCQAYLDAQRSAATRKGSPHAAMSAPVLVTTPAHRASLEAAYSDAIADLWVLDDACFKAISQVDSPTGWGLVIPLAKNSITDSVASMHPLEGADSGLSDLVVLDRLSDPGNAGAIVRSVAGAGVKTIWCIRPHVEMWSPKVLRAAMGAHFAVTIVEDLSEEDVILQLDQLKLQRLATALSPNAVSLYAPQLDLRQPTAWVFGQEAHGVSPGLLGAAKAVRIPQSAAIESLNVAASAAVCLFEMRRQRLSR